MNSAHRIGSAAAWAAVLFCAASLAGPARAAVMTVAGVTFDTGNAVQTLEMVSGVSLGGDPVTTGYATPHGDALWSGTTPDFPAASLGALVQRPVFQPGYDPGSPAPGAAGTAVSLGSDPDISGLTQERNVIRLTFGEESPGVLNRLTNHGGYDLAIFEQATTEAYAIRVRNASGAGGAEDDGWSAWMYKVAETIYDSGTDSTATLFELGAFGIVEEQDVIDIIEITNLTVDDRIAFTGTELAAGLGEGEVVFNAEAGYDPARWSESSAGYKSFESFKFNPDIQYVVGLHNLNNPPAGDTEAPEPGAALIFAAAALALLRRARRKT
jgi:hypothetical protein